MSDEIPSIEDLLKKTGAKSTGAPLQDETTTEKVETKLEEIKIKEKEEVTRKESEGHKISYANLVGFPISPEAIALIPEQQAKELKVVCFLYTGPEIRLGTTDTSNEKVKELLYQLEERHKAHGVIYSISENSFQTALNFYRTLPKIRKEVNGVEITSDELEKYQKEIHNVADLQKIIAKVSITDVITLSLAAALQMGSSDVHIEAEEKGIVVRYRIDGVLQEVAVIPKQEWKQIVSRLKLVAGLKINITDKPQDGRFTIFLKDEKIEVRVSSLPTAFGESVVMRLLRPETISFEFERLGLRPLAYEKLKKEIEKPNGMIMTTGPTGSGKTTTLYAVLRQLNTPGVKIITLEDPVEYRLEGINQSQIDSSREYTFAKGLRSILRQDPDIVMVGEIRDLETAEISIQAALTGHLMLSTVHTNDAAGAIPRLISMGVKPFLLAPALRVIIGQRLVRRICENCKAETEIDEQQLARAKKILTEIPETSGEKINLEDLKFYHGKGCEQCNSSGYHGRVGIYEVLLINKEVEKAILEGKTSEYDMRQIAQNQGMITMVQDGILKATNGQTTVDEVFRVSI